MSFRPLESLDHAMIVARAWCKSNRDSILLKVTNHSALAILRWLDGDEMRELNVHRPDPMELADAICDVILLAASGWRADNEKE